MAKLWSRLCHDLRVYRLSMRVQLRAAMMLRGAFITQILGMIFNNICFLGAWLFFFDHFGTINGWSADHFIGMAGIQFFVFGIVCFLTVGIVDLPRYVDTGSLDTFLTKPTSVLSGLASSNVDVTTLGDMFLGLLLIGWYAVHVGIDPATAGLFLVAVLAGCIAFFCFAILLPNTIAFYMFDSEKLSRYIGVVFIDTGFYPIGVLGGAMRIFFLLFFPALLVAATPADIMKNTHLEWAWLGLIVSLLWLAISLWVFKKALRKYESANLVGAR